MPPNPLAQALHGLVGRHCTKSRGQDRCFHGDQGQSHWRVGRQWLMLVLVCSVFFCVVFCVLWSGAVLASRIKLT